MSLQAIVTKTTDGPPVGIVALYGEVNSETVSLLDAHLNSLLQQCGRVVVDFSQTSYVSSAGWRSLVDRCSKTRPAGVAVACMQVSVRDVYDLLGMGYVLGAFDTVRDALAALQQPPAQPADAGRKPTGSVA